MEEAVRREQTWLVKKFVIWQLSMNYTAFENKSTRLMPVFKDNGPYGKISTKKGPIRAVGFTSSPLTNRVRGAYLNIVFFPRSWHKREVRRPWIKGEKRGSVTYCTDREDQASKI